MKAAPKPSRPPARPLRWIQRLFTWQLRWRRRNGRWRLVFEDPRAQAAPVPGKVPAAAPVKAQPAPFETEPATEAPADPMQTELHELLKQHAAARELMRHLAFLERALKLAGADKLGDMPLDVLKKGLAQLEGLVTDWSSPGLAQLRLQLTMVIADKEDDAPQAQQRATASQP